MKLQILLQHQHFLSLSFFPLKQQNPGTNISIPPRKIDGWDTNLISIVSSSSCLGPTLRHLFRICSSLSLQRTCPSIFISLVFSKVPLCLIPFYLSDVKENDVFLPLFHVRRKALPPHVNAGILALHIRTMNDSFIFLSGGSQWREPTLQSQNGCSRCCPLRNACLLFQPSWGKVWHDSQEEGLIRPT